MKRSAASLHTSCSFGSCIGSAVIGGDGGSDSLRRHVRSVFGDTFSRKILRAKDKPALRTSRATLISIQPSSSSSAAIAQWLQRRHTHHVAPISRLRSHSDVAGGAIGEDQLCDTALVNSHGPSDESTPSSSVTATSDVDADTLEASLISQLQTLAKEYRGGAYGHRATKLVDSDTIRTAVLASAESDDDSNVALSRDSEPAWQRGLEAAQKFLNPSMAIMEWALFLGLRSNQVAAVAAGSSSGAPLEVLDGVYAAWRDLHRTQKQINNSTNVETAPLRVDTALPLDPKHHASSPQTPTPCRSPPADPPHRRPPFTPKGVHYHYAVYLLHELHRVQTAFEVYRATNRGGDGCINGGAGNNNGPTSTGDVNSEWVTLTHRAHYILNRVLEVLLVHLPQDAAAAASGSAGKVTERTYGVQVPRSRKDGCSPTSLRPTTALLILEAVRHAAQLQRQSSMQPSAALPGNFPFLAHLWESAEDGGVHQVAPTVCPPLARTALAAVAREAFEYIIRNASMGPPVHTPTGTNTEKQHQLHRLQEDAVVLYVAFLTIVHIPRMSESRLLAQLRAVDRFVLAGSWTTRRLSVPSQQNQSLGTSEDGPLVGPAKEPHDPSGSASSPPALATATGMRMLLSTYTTAASAATTTMAPISEPQTTDRRRQCDQTREGVVATLCNPNSLLTLSSGEASSHTDTQESDAHVVSPRPPTSSLPWCAWILRVLVHEDALQKQKHGTRKAPSGDPTHDNTKGVSTLALATQLVTELHRHVQVTCTPAKSLRSTSDALHRRAQRLRRVQQLVWATILDAAVRGQLTSFDLHSGVADNSASTFPSAWGGSGGRGDAPAVLQKLCYPYYDKSQWHRGSVNLYMHLLDQWGQSTQVRQVFATVARRERRSQLAIRRAVLAEHRKPTSVGGKVDEQDEDHPSCLDDQQREASGITNIETAPPPTVTIPHENTMQFSPRYRPALTLASCLITLRHCGCPRRVLGELMDERVIYENGNESGHSAAVTVSQARLSGEVLQYMICSLHAVELMARRVAPRGGDADTDDKQAEICNTSTQRMLSADDRPEDMDVDTVMVEGLPIGRWVEWIRGSCVPAVAHLHQSTGLKDEWAQLGYGFE